MPLSARRLILICAAALWVVAACENAGGDKSPTVPGGTGTAEGEGGGTGTGEGEGEGEGEPGTDPTGTTPDTDVVGGEPGTEPAPDAGPDPGPEPGTDAGPEPGPDAGPDPGTTPDDACLNETDLGVIAADDGAIEAAVQACAVGCVGEADMDACAHACVAESTNLSDTCSSCWGGLAACAGTACLADCSADIEGEACNSCINDFCLADFEACSGLEDSEPEPEPDATEPDTTEPTPDLDTTEPDTTEPTPDPDITEPEPGDGACTNADDLAVIDSVDVAQSAKVCGIECLAGSDDPAACAVGCIAEATGLSAECSGCYAGQVACATEVCLDQCLGGSAEECTACLDEMGCLVSFYECSGLGGETPDPEPDVVDPEPDIVDPEPEPVEDACLGDEDLAVLAETDVEGAAISCALGCSGTDDPGACSADCIAEDTNLSTDCASCFGNQIACVVDACAAPCISDPEGEECLACMDEAGCVAAFEDCSGLVGGGTDPEPEPEGGLCANDADGPILLENEETLQAETTSCGTECFSQGPGCVADCMSESLGLSGDCASCFEDAFACAMEACFNECAFAPQSAECASCAELSCSAAQEYCITGEATAPEPEPEPTEDPCAAELDPCDPTDDQPAEFICVQDADGMGWCRAACVMDVEGECPEGEECGDMGGLGIGFCVPTTCEGFFSDDCGPGANCWVQDDLHFCAPAGEVGELDLCESIYDCAEGLLCFGTCVQPECDVFGNLACEGEGLDTCSPLAFGNGAQSDLGVCIDGCTPFANLEGDCPEGSSCEAFAESFFTGDLQGQCAPFEGNDTPLGETCAYTSACCGPLLGPGCGDAFVENCVCAQDAYCCETEWDAQCAAEAEGFGCVPFCDPCEPGAVCVNSGDGAVCQQSCYAEAELGQPGACAESVNCAPLLDAAAPDGTELLGFCDEGVVGCEPFADGLDCAEGEYCAVNFLDLNIGECAEVDPNAGDVGSECPTPITEGCCGPQDGPGCGDEEIEACVCELDAACCDTLWDQLCADSVELFDCGSCTTVCGADQICIGTCEIICDPDAETGSADVGACAFGQSCIGLQNGGIPLAVGACVAGCDYHDVIACPDEENEECQMGELLSGDDTCIDKPDMPGYPLDHGEPCPIGFEGGAFCGPGRFCVNIGEPTPICMQACATSEAPFGPDHPDCPGATACEDLFGLPEVGLCFP